jgi:hypothetical protein
MRTCSRRTPFLALALAGAAAGTAVAATLATGPSSSQSPYLVPSTLGVEVTSILTVGDSVNLKPNGTPYRMVGLPDGLGAFEDDDDCGRDTFTVLMNHELTSSVGSVRAHGAKGAFVSKWTIDKRTLKVVRGADLIERVWRPVPGGWDASTPLALNRLCSADLPERGAFWDRRSKKGYEGRLFMNGEEAGAEGSAFAHAMTGDSWQLPALGKLSWENCVANPDTGVKTVVVGTDDGTGGQVYVYVGTKQKTGNPAEKAGLANGTLFGIKISGFAAENALTGIPDGTPFTAHAFGDVSTWTGATLEAQSQANSSRASSGPRTAPGTREQRLLLRHHGELHRREPSVAPPLRRPGEPGRRRPHRPAARRQRGPEDDGQPLRVAGRAGPHPGGSGQRARLPRKGLAL